MVAGYRRALSPLLILLLTISFDFFKGSQCVQFIVRCLCELLFAQLPPAELLLPISMQLLHFRKTNKHEGHQFGFNTKGFSR